MALGRRRFASWQPFTLTSLAFYHLRLRDRRRFFPLLNPLPRTMYFHHVILPAAGVARGSQKTLRALVGRISGGHAIFVSRLLFALRFGSAHHMFFISLCAINNNNNTRLVCLLLPPYLVSANVSHGCGCGVLCLARRARRRSRSKKACEHTFGTPPVKPRFMRMRSARIYLQISWRCPHKPLFRRNCRRLSRPRSHQIFA